MCPFQRVHYDRCAHTDSPEVMPYSCNIYRRHVDGGCPFDHTYSVVAYVLDYDNLCATCDPEGAETRRGGAAAQGLIKWQSCRWQEVYSLVT